MALYQVGSPTADDLLELKINWHFDQIVAKVNARRVELLTELRQKIEESRAKELLREGMASQVAAVKSQVETCLKENPLKQIQQKMAQELENELEKLEVNPKQKAPQFLINTNILLKSLETLGEITERLIVDYRTFQPIITVAKIGNAPGEIREPFGVAIDETNGNIFIAEFTPPRISVFSQNGIFIKVFRTEMFTSPRGIAIHKSDLYVSDMNNHEVFRIRMPNMELLQRVGRCGSENEEFQSPFQLDISSQGEVHVCDFHNNRIQVLTPDLKYLTAITHESMTKPFDIKVTEEFMYVLSHSDSPCLHLFTLNGVKIRSIISMGKGMQIDKPKFFCINSNADIIISNHGDHSIKIFTSEGELLHRIGQEGHVEGTFFKPRGVALTKAGALICVSENKNFGLQIFDSNRPIP